MSYAKEKEKIRRKHRKIKYAVVTILMIAVAGVCIFSWFVPPSSWKYYVSLPDVSKRREGELRIHFLDVGQGDCTLLEFPDGQTMLIDGGDGQWNFYYVFKFLLYLIGGFFTAPFVVLWTVYKFIRALRR